jgi:hypothetical protein
MRSLVGFIIVTLGLGVLTSCAGTRAVEPEGVTTVPLHLADVAAAPDTKPALPAGHPALPGAGGAGGSLPSGHPPIPADNQANPGLPAGHPQVEPVAAPPGTKGSITIKAVQATKGGPAVGADAVVVEYYNARGEVAAKNQATLSDKGEVTIKDVALTNPVQPLITITHAGVEYKAPGNVMDGNNREQEVEVSVYETTDKEPAWGVRMRHVIVQPGREGLDVTDMISVFNPDDHTWTGKAPTAGGGKPVTLALPLPRAATNVRAGAAFHECCVKVENGKLIYSMPMQPGGAEFQIHYTVPAADDKAEVAIVAPAATGSVFVFLPDDGSVVTSNELKKVDPKPGAKLKANSRFYTAAPQKAGDVIAFTVSGLKALKADATPVGGGAGGGYGDATDAGTAIGGGSAAASGIPGVAKLVGGVGAGLILVVGAAVVIFKSPKMAGAAL